MQKMDVTEISCRQVKPQERKVDSYYHIENCSTGELLYVGSKLLDENRRYALTWMGDPNEDPAFVWKITEKTKGFHHIENKQTGELLYVGSKMLDASKRHAVTWMGNPNNDPAMLWNIVYKHDNDGEASIVNAKKNETLCTGNALLDAHRRRVYTTDADVEGHASLWRLKSVS